MDYWIFGQMDRWNFDCRLPIFGLGQKMPGGKVPQNDINGP